MRELDRDRHVRPAANAFQRLRQRRLGGVVIKTDIAIGDAPLGHHRCRLDRQQRGTRQGEIAEMDLVPVVHAAVDRGILAHGRDHDPVVEREPADGDGGEESGAVHRLTVRM
jgi:hypothetical protein